MIPLDNKLRKILEPITNKMKIIHGKSMNNFGKAIEGLKRGAFIQRVGWNESKYVFKQIPAQISPDIIPKMQSVPQSVKNKKMIPTNCSLKYEFQLAIVQGESRISSWTPTAEDIFASDWLIIGIDE